ncbi:MAG: hypothetical protein QOC89_1155 [Paraburkholderia sp.]|nr:hypothetical protein [Paraburkholderia sp.]
MDERSLRDDLSSLADSANAGGAGPLTAGAAKPVRIPYRGTSKGTAHAGRCRGKSANESRRQHDAAPDCKRSRPS